MPSWKTLPSVARKHGVSFKTVEKYWYDGREKAEEYGAKNPYSYAMRIVMNRLQNKHKKKKKSDRTRKEEFSKKLRVILDS